MSSTFTVTLDVPTLLAVLLVAAGWLFGVFLLGYNKGYLSAVKRLEEMFWGRRR